MWQTGDIAICLTCKEGGIIRKKKSTKFKRSKVVCGKCGSQHLMKPFEPHHTITFGKYKGVMLMEIPHPYFIWLYDNFEYIKPDLKYYIETVIL